MKERYKEWLRQADYDLDTAEVMLAGGRNFYAVFMCHLAIEKALKGLFQHKLAITPPKTHNLIYLLQKLNMRPPSGQDTFLVSLNESHVATRYPDELNQLMEQYQCEKVREIIDQTKGILTWIKSRF